MTERDRAWDVWAYYHASRGLVYFVTPQELHSPDGESLETRPAQADIHIAVVWASNKREAIHKAAKLNRDWSGK